MTHSLTDAFRSYATESEEVDLTVHDQQNANPEPFVAVTDETTTVLEDAVADIAADADKLTENGDLAEKLIDAVESMEGTILAVKSMKAAGENRLWLGERQVDRDAETLERSLREQRYIKLRLEALRQKIASGHSDAHTESLVNNAERELTLVRNTINRIESK